MTAVVISSGTAWPITAIILGGIALGGVVVWVKARYFPRRRK